MKDTSLLAFTMMAVRASCFSRWGRKGVPSVGSTYRIGASLPAPPERSRPANLLIARAIGNSQATRRRLEQSNLPVGHAVGELLCHRQHWIAKRCVIHQTLPKLLNIGPNSDVAFPLYAFSSRAVSFNSTHRLSIFAEATAKPRTDVIPIARNRIQIAPNNVE